MNLWSHLWAIVTSDREKAASLIEEIERSRRARISHRINSSNEMLIQFSDGVRLKWIRPTESARGYRIGRMWCDVNVDQDILNTVILPKYRGKLEDIMWFGGD